MMLQVGASLKSCQLCSNTLFSWTANTKKVPKKPFLGHVGRGKEDSKNIYFLKSSVIVRGKYLGPNVLVYYVTLYPHFNH